MLKHQLIHPKISEVLARAGHHSVILIADGNYPVWGKKGPNAELVSLNLSPGIPTVAQVLRAVLSAVPVDAARDHLVDLRLVGQARRVAAAADQEGPDPAFQPVNLIGDVGQVLAAAFGNVVVQRQLGAGPDRGQRIAQAMRHRAASAPNMAEESL